MEVRYRQVCDTLLTDEARARALVAQRLLLTRVKIEMLTLRSRDAAQEAVLCLKEKLLSKEELAKECRASWNLRNSFWEIASPRFNTSLFPLSLARSSRRSLMKKVRCIPDRG